MNKTPDQQVDELVAGLKMILLHQAPNAIQRQATEKELDSFGERAKVEKPCARDPRSPVPLTLAVQNSLTL